MNARTGRFSIAVALLCTAFGTPSMAVDSSDAAKVTFATGHERSTPNSDAKLDGTAYTPLPAPSAATLFSGRLFYWISNANAAASIAATQIVNNSGNATSGALSLRLFVTTEPITGAFNYLTVGEQPLDPLRPTYAYNNLSTAVPLTIVPDGIYYFHLGVFEYAAACTGSSDGYCLDDYATFPSQIRVVGGIYVVSGDAESVKTAD